MRNVDLLFCLVFMLWQINPTTEKPRKMNTGENECCIYYERIFPFPYMIFQTE